MAPMSKGKWREKQSIPDVPFQQQFTRNHFYQSRQRNTSVWRAKLESREDWWFAGASGTSQGSPCQPQPFPTQHQVHQMCHQHREMPSLPRGKGCISLLQCQTQVTLFPWHLCQQDPNPQGTSLPLCPPASPRTPLLDALLLSGSGSVDPGLASCVKDHPLRSKPCTPPPQLSLWEYNQLMIQTHHSHTSRDSLMWQKELQALLPSTDHFPGTAMPGHTSMGLEGFAKLLEWSYGHTRLNSWWRTTPPQRCVSEVPFCFPPQKDWSLWLSPDKPDWHLLFSVTSLIKNLPHTPRIVTPLREKASLERIQSLPLKSVFPVSISAMIQPIDQISTVQREKGGSRVKEEKKLIKKAAAVAGSVIVACSKHWFQFLSLPPSSVLSMLLNSLLSSFPASTSSGSCVTPLGPALLQGALMIKRKKQPGNSVRFEPTGSPSLSLGSHSWGRAAHLSGCNASSSGWLLGLCTTVWPRSQSSQHQPVWPSQNPGSAVPKEE